MKKFTIFLIAAGLMFGSCSDFLKEYSQDKVYANNCTDLMELLIGSVYMTPTTGNTAISDVDSHFPFMFLMDDDVARYLGPGFFGTVTDSGEEYTGWYKWKKEPGYGETAKLKQDNAWFDLYSRIAVANTVLLEAERFPSDPLQPRVKGESYFLRACYYYLLVNLYAQPYSAATAATEPGVPLKLKPEVTGEKWARTPVGEVYAQIIRDLEQAAGYLKTTETVSVLHADENAAKVLLSRVYLYMGEWAKAEKLCDELLATTSKSFVDLNSTTTAESFGHAYLESPETIFSFAGTEYFRSVINDSPSYNQRYGGFHASQDLTSAYEDTDLRFGRYITKQTSGTIFPFPQKVARYSIANRKMPISEVFSLRLPEVYLNKAEAMAMQEKGAADIVAELNKLRVNRYQGRVATPITATGENLVKFIRDERRRELCFEGHRWFDLRRYAVCPKYPASKEIRHREVDKGNIIKGYYILKPYAEDRNAYVLPIPTKELIYNEGVMVENPRDEREMVNP